MDCNFLHWNQWEKSCWSTQHYQSIGTVFCNIKLLWWKTTICITYSAHILFSFSWKMITIKKNKKVNEEKKFFLKMRRITQWLNSIMTLNDLPSIPDLCIDLFFTPLFCMYWLANKELFCYFCPLKAFYLQRERKHFIKHHCVLWYIFFLKFFHMTKIDQMFHERIFFF